MNLRNRYLVITLRTLFGLFMLASGIGGLLAAKSAQASSDPMAVLTQSLWSMGILQMIKITEIVAGAMLLIGFLPALAAIFIAPVAVGIVVFGAVVEPSVIPIGIVICLLNAYFGYVYWDKYKALFSRT